MERHGREPPQTGSPSERESGSKRVKRPTNRMNPPGYNFPKIISELTLLTSLEL